MGSDENHFNVSLILRDKITRRQCPQTTTFLKRRTVEAESKRGPSAYRLTARPTEGELFISAQLSTDAVSALRKVWVVLYNKTVETMDLSIVQELCESRGGRPELSVLTSLLASVDVKIY